MIFFITEPTFCCYILNISNNVRDIILLKIEPSKIENEIVSIFDSGYIYSDSYVQIFIFDYSYDLYSH